MFLPFTNLASKNNKFLISRFRKKKKKKKEEALCKRKAKGHRWHFYLHDVATDIDPIVPCKSWKIKERENIRMITHGPRPFILSR